MLDTFDIQTTADQILLLERGALDRWGKGDPGGFLEVYATDITYFDPLIAARIDGYQAMDDYYRPCIGKIRVTRYEMLTTSCVSEHDAGDVGGAGSVNGLGASKANSDNPICGLTKSLDASGGSVFRKIIGPAMVE